MNFNVNSPPQISQFLFDYLKLDPIKMTDGGKSGIKKASTDESVIKYYAEKENNEFCKLLLQYRKFNKARGTYIPDIRRYLQDREYDGKLIRLVHPDLALHLVETYRSSANSPNLQNQPKHEDIITFYTTEGERDNRRSVPWKIIRKAFRCRIGYLLAEVDYEGAEVKTAANISGDRQLIEDLNNDMDMHSHWVNVIFEMELPLEVIKKTLKDQRHVVKNNWTFANFYGAGPNSMADSFCKFDIFKEFVEKKFKKMKNREGGFNAFMKDFSVKHFADCQEVFWDRYRTFAAWQKQLVKEYFENGYVETILGFRRYHPLKRNEVLNTPIQSTSFHMLLHAIIEIQKKLLTDDYESYMIGQVHDSILFMIKPREAYAMMDMVDDVMINHKLPVPKKAKLGTEWDMGKDWFDMKTIPKAA
jgi:DNA polymerase-1